MDNANLWHLRNQIFEDLSHEDVLNCRRVCKFWNESLRRISDLKLIKEFVNWRYVFDEEKQEYNKLSTIIPGWKNATKKYGVRASMEDLEEVKNSLKKLARPGPHPDDLDCQAYPVHQAAKDGDVRLMELILNTSYDFNARDFRGRTALHYACMSGRTEIVQLLITSFKDLGIDLNARDDDELTALDMAMDMDISGYDRTEILQLLIKSSIEFSIDLNARGRFGRTIFHKACKRGRTEFVEFMIKSSKHFSIDLNAKDDDGWTALHTACIFFNSEIVGLMVKNWKEFGIDIKARGGSEGKTPIELVRKRIIEPGFRFFDRDQKVHLERILLTLEIAEDEYSRMDA